MKRAMAIIPAVIISALITAMNIHEASLTVMKPLSLSGLILMAAVMNLKKKRLGLSAIDIGVVIYTSLVTGIFWLSPAFLVNAVSAYAAGMLFVCLFCVTALPALFRKRYFTEYFAEKTTPEAVRSTDIYKNINRNMSWAWSALFAVSALLNTVPLIASAPSGLFTMLFFQILLPLTFMLGLGLPLNRRYPAYYQRRMGIVPVAAKGKQMPIKP